MKRTLLVFLALGGAWVAYTQNPQGKQAPATQTKAPAPFNLIKIADDLYDIDGGQAGNVAVYITNEGVIMVDDKFEQNFDEIMANVKKVTNQPIKYILSTHYHADHSGGNTRFSSIAEIISTRNAHDGIVRTALGNTELVLHGSYYRHATPTGPGDFDDPGTAEREWRSSIDLKHHHAFSTVFSRTARSVETEGREAPYTHTMSPQSSGIRSWEGTTMLALHITPSERAVLEYLASGAAIHEIARRVGMNEPEIETCLQTLFTRMGVRTRAEAVSAAMRRGLLAA